MKGKGQQINIAVKLDKLSTEMEMTRKILRFGRSIGMTMKIVKIMRDILDGEEKNIPKAIIRLLREVCLMMYFLFDHYVWFEKVQNMLDLDWRIQKSRTSCKILLHVVCFLVVLMHFLDSHKYLKLYRPDPEFSETLFNTSSKCDCHRYTTQRTRYPHCCRLH